MSAGRHRIDWAEVRRDLDRSRSISVADAGLSPERRAEILRERSTALAGRRLHSGPQAHSVPMATFMLGDERYALPLTALVAAVRDRPLGPVPGASATIIGTLYERGEIWTIHDPRKLLGTPGTAARERGFLLLLRGHRRPTGLRVDALGQVRRIDPDQLGPSGPSSAAAHPLVRGATADAVAVLDAAGLRNHPALTEVT